MSMMKALTIGAASIALSAVIAAAPGSVSAATVTGDLADGGSTDVTFGVNSPFPFQGGVSDIESGTSGFFEHTFNVDPAGFGHADVSVTTTNFERLASVTIQWITGGDSATIDGPAGEEASVGTTFSLTQPSDTLRISWVMKDDVPKGSLSFAGTITAIPLPAAGWLLLGGLGALGGMAATRRRREMAA